MMQTGANVFPGKEWESARPEAQGVSAEKLDQAMAVLRDISLHHGTDQSLVVRRGRVLWQGPDIDNKHTIWSCCKTFMAMAFGLLADDGTCSLDTRAADILPSLATDYPAVTLRHFANFTCGYRGRAGGDTVEYFEPGEPLHPPGTHFHYSQASDMLAYLLTLAAGEPLRDLFRRRIAQPIAMDPAGWSWGDWGEVGGLVVCGGSGSFDRGMSITARQIGRVGWMLANRGRWGDRQLLSSAWMDAMTSPQVAADIPPLEPDGWYLRLPGSYGANTWINGVTPNGKRMWPAAPAGTFAIQGNNNNFCFAIPEWNMTLVRLGTDGRINNNRYDCVFVRLREALGEPA